MKVEDQSVPVYAAKVAPAEPAGRWKAMDDKTNSANYFTHFGDDVEVVPIKRDWGVL